mmetsp:Transcript_41396/g.95622  ORF Transcript_41396/g.95622 Transcript_41396/m.95622 type:complete len:275 (-) Transcript_41396:1079-1903(-)
MHRTAVGSVAATEVDHQLALALLAGLVAFPRRLRSTRAHHEATRPALGAEADTAYAVEVHVELARATPPYDCAHCPRLRRERPHEPPPLGRWKRTTAVCGNRLVEREARARINHVPFVRTHGCTVGVLRCRRHALAVNIVHQRVLVEHRAGSGRDPHVVAVTIFAIVFSYHLNLRRHLRSHRRRPPHLDGIYFNPARRRLLLLTLHSSYLARARRRGLDRWQSTSRYVRRCLGHEARAGCESEWGPGVRCSCGCEHGCGGRNVLFVAFTLRGEI